MLGGNWNVRINPVNYYRNNTYIPAIEFLASNGPGRGAKSAPLLGHASWAGGSCWPKIPDKAYMVNPSKKGE